MAVLGMVLRACHYTKRSSHIRTVYRISSEQVSTQGSAQFSLKFFPTRARGTAQGFCYNVGRGVSAIAPPMIGYIVSIYGFAIGLATVSIFAVAAAVVVLTLPETKGKVLDNE